jgi:tRNA (guanine9-N1)-methyltransferase
MDPACAYVVGGVIDRNRHKGLTAGVAAQHGLRTARLPIAESGIRMAASQVLTTSHGACARWREDRGGGGGLGDGC